MGERGKGEGLSEGLRYWHDVSKSTSMCTVQYACLCINI
jgi:hypothetical protein